MDATAAAKRRLRDLRATEIRASGFRSCATMSLATVLEMTTPRSRHAARLRANRRRAQARARRFALAMVIAAVATLLLTAFDHNAVPSSSGAPVPAPLPVTSAPPEAQVLATVGNLRVQSPVARGGVTAVGFHGSVEGALVLQPVGPQANEGLVARLWRKITGSSRTGLAWYQLESVDPANPGSRRSRRDGRLPPVDGTVVAIRDQLVSGRKIGAEIELRPTSAPSLVVTIQNVRPDTGLAVGANVTPEPEAGTRRGHQQVRAPVPRSLCRRRREQRRDPGVPLGNARRPPGFRLRVPALRILFIADVVGGPGPDRAPGSPASLRADLEIDVRRERGERRRRDRDHASPRTRCSPPGQTRSLSETTPSGVQKSARTRQLDRVVRPANMSKRVSGRGLAVVPTANGARLAVVNVLGSLFLDPATSMFEVIDDLVDEAVKDTARPRRRPRGSDEREGRARPLARRASHGSGRNAHACADIRRVRPREAPHSSPTPA